MKTLRRLLTVLILTTPIPAFAHAFLVKSIPGVGATLSTPPRQLLMIYTEDLEIPFCTVTVTGPAGTNVATGKPQPVPRHKEQMIIELSITAPGTYTATWHAVSVDTHHTQGSFHFTVLP